MCGRLDGREWGEPGFGETQDVCITCYPYMKTHIRLDFLPGKLPDRSSAQRLSEPWR
jgi:hypothetical protein